MPEHQILAVKPMPDYLLRLDFATGEKKIFDVKPYIRGHWFGQLRDTAYFNQVRIIAHGEGIEWPAGQDIAPHELYDLSVDLS